jgi:hypothetical protein
MKTSVIFFAMMLTAIVAFGQEQKLNEIKVTAPQFQSEIFYSANDFLEHAVEFPANQKMQVYREPKWFSLQLPPMGRLQILWLLIVYHLKLTGKSSGYWKSPMESGLPER